MESLLGVPIRSGDTVLGNLYLANKQGANAFTQSDQTLLEMFAAHAAVALQNARLIERIEELAVLAERQRVGIARALMTAPKVLLVDEPTSMLDHKRGHAIVELLAEQCAQHQVATLMVTHDQSMLSAANTVMRIQDGRLTQER